jgi:hypothetical protein
MFGRSKYLDLIGAALALSLLTIGVGLIGMYVVLPLVFPEQDIGQNLLTAEEHASYILEQAAIAAVRQAMAAGIFKATCSALACGIVWLFIASVWTPDRPGTAGMRGYVWTALWAATAIGAWFLCAWPLAGIGMFIKKPEAFLAFRVVATSWAFLAFGLVTWVTTPSIAVPALGPLGRLRYGIVRQFKPLFSRVVE